MHDDPPPLLERDHEIAELEAAVAAVARGVGALVLVEGEPGIGKTALLGAATGLARAGGGETLMARGGEYERDLPFGVVRQLLETRLHRAGEEERARLLSGAARHAGAVLGVGEAAVAADEPSLVHALFWVAANLADRGPVCITVDDAQWSDLPSLRWLLYVARRLEELSVVLVVGIRSGEPDEPRELLDGLRGVPAARMLEPKPLGREAGRALVRREIADDATTDAVSAALHEASGGNPFLLQEAAATLAQEGGVPEAKLRPPAVASSVLRRLDRLGESAAALVRAVAVLGPDATLAAAAALSGVQPAPAARATDDLARARILEPGQPLAFVHPVLRSTVYSGMPHAERSRAHADAARILRAAGVGAARVVSHLLAADPAGDPRVVELLRDAAACETDPRRAVDALRRALAEPPAPEVRTAVLSELGETEMRAYLPEAVDHLMQARELAPTPAERLAATVALARAWTLDPRPEEAVAWARAELAALTAGPDADGAAREVRLALRALEVIRGRVEREQAERLRAEAGAASTVAERYLIAALAYKATDFGTAADGLELAERALEGGLRHEGIRGTGAILVLGALETSDALDLADAVALDHLAHAREHGDVSGAAIALTAHANIACLRGALADAESEAFEALALADAHGLDWAEPLAIATLLEALGEQGRGPEADRVLADRELTDWQQGSARGANYLFARAKLRLAQQRWEDAVADFAASGVIMARYEIDHPALMNWRSGAAEGLLGLGRAGDAAALAAEDLELARPFGSAQPVGAALRALGLAVGGAEGLGHLREAAAVLEDSPARLVRARALVDLGAALRRMNERAAARDPLRAGLDLAHRCGANALAERAELELEASGARPRRRAVTGLDALTPSELRVARMAAAGQSNRDIAQSLFLSVRTIENQLRQVYAKLGIGSRRDLETVL